MSPVTIKYTMTMFITWQNIINSCGGIKEKSIQILYLGCIWALTISQNSSRPEFILQYNSRSYPPSYFYGFSLSFGNLNINYSNKNAVQRKVDICLSTFYICYLGFQKSPKKDAVSGQSFVLNMRLAWVNMGMEYEWHDGWAFFLGFKYVNRSIGLLHNGNPQFWTLGWY